MENSIKTLEFKLTLNHAQSDQIDRWMQSQQHVWNSALSLLLQHQKFSHYNKIDKQNAPCCPIPWEYRYIPNGNGDGYLTIPYSPYTSTRKGRKYHPCCPIPQAYQVPEINSQHKFSLVPWFAYKTLGDRRLPNGFSLDVDLITFAPSKFMQGTIELLHTSWQEYKKGKRAVPRFKSSRSRNEMTTIRNNDHLNIKDGDYIKLPKMKGRVKAKSLARRMANVIKICQGFTISKKASGYYLYVSVEVPKKSVRSTDIAAGFDAGVAHLLTDDKGRHIENPRYLQKLEKRLKRLQRKASRKYSKNLGKTKNWEKLKAEIAVLHEKIARQRKAYSHKQSTFITRKFGTVIMEDLNLAGMKKRAKPKPNADGTGYEHNGAAAKSGLNKAISDAGMGQLIALIKQKSEDNGRTFIKVPAHHTSQTCFACGHVSKNNRKSQADFTCESCGYSDNADANAAKNIKQRGLEMLE